MVIAIHPSIEKNYRNVLQTLKVQGGLLQMGVVKESLWM